MDAHFFPPPPHLTHLFKGVWTLRGRGESRPAPVFPDGSAELVFNVGDVAYGGRALDAMVVHPRSLVVGQMTGPVWLSAGAEIDLIGLRIQPWAVGAVVGPAHQALGMLIDARALLGERICEELGDQLASTPDAGTRAKILFAAVGRLFGPRFGISGTVHSMLSASVQLPFHFGVDHWARQVNRSPRQLERIARRWIGLSPKLFLRMRRFQGALRLATRRPDLTLARIAMEAGYFDQAHLSRDFAQFAEDAPGRVLGRMETVTASMVSS